MDNGLRRVLGRKVSDEIFDVDLAGFARAVTSMMRGQAAARITKVSGAPYVRIHGLGVEAVVSLGVWERVLGLMKTDRWLTQVVPVESAVRDVNSLIRLSSSTVENRDPLYQRIYGALRLLFPRKVPT